MPVPAPFTTVLRVATSRRLTINVPYAEVPGSPEVSSLPDRVMARRTFLVPWSQRWDFCLAMLGWSEVATNKGGSYIARTIPQSFRPVDPVSNLPPVPDTSADSANLVAASVEDMRGMAVPSGKPLTANTKDDQWQAPVYQYTFARVTIGYELPHYQILDDDEMVNPNNDIEAAPGPFADSFGNPDESYLVRYVTRHRAPAVISSLLPGGSVKYVDDGSQAINKTPFNIHQTDVMLIWRQVPLIPTAVFSHVGCVNNATFVDNTQRRQNIHYSFPAGTLLLAGVQIETYRQINGQYANDITYRFSQFDPSGNGTAGHNYSWRVKNGQIIYDQITASGLAGGQPLYPSADFRLLFRAA